MVEFQQNKYNYEQSVRNEIIENYTIRFSMTWISYKVDDIKLQIEKNLTFS